MRKIAVLVVLAMVIAGCGGDGEGVDVDGAWARPSPRMASAGAVYMDLTSADGDRLIGAAVDASVAGTVEIHETAMADMGGEGDMGGDDGEMGGAMTMREVGEIALPAGETVPLEPGGYHVMLLDLPQPLEMGQTFDVVLQFETAGEVTIEVEVRDEAP